MHGIAIDGGRADQRIGRDVWFDGTTWHQRADTRIAPGDTLVMARAWSAGRTAEAARVRVTLEVAPDDYYEGFYTHSCAPRCHRRSARSTNKR